jgi:nucleotide-binding universal stress UspA family protein
MCKPKEPYAIVVAIDYSDDSDLVLEKALELAARNADAVVHAINVVPAQPPALVDGVSEVFNNAAPLLGRAAERLKGYAEERVARFRDRHADVALLGSMRVVVHQRFVAPAEEIAQLAADLEADLVIVGAHGRHGLPRMTLGSVAEAVVRLAPCPVLVVRPKKLAAPLPVIEPPCPCCVQARKASEGKVLWCDQHRERHGQRHTYFQGERAGAESAMPFVARA